MRPQIRSDKRPFMEGTGFLLLHKRFESGSLSWPRTTEKTADLTEEQYRYLMLPFMAGLTGNKCWKRLAKGSTTNRNHGRWRSYHYWIHKIKLELLDSVSHEIIPVTPSMLSPVYSAIS